MNPKLALKGLLSMRRRSRNRGGGWFLLWVFPILLIACGGKETIREEPPRAASAESLVFLSAVQGNPLCLLVDIHQRRAASLFGSPKAKWQIYAWLVYPGASTQLCTKKGKTKKGTMAPVSWTNDKLLFTTDKEEFVFYDPLKPDKLLLLTDPIFADRVRSGEEEEIRYGRMPAKLFWNNRTIEGNLFYERRIWTEPPPHKRRGPLVGLEPGDRIFAVWGPDGEFLYLEQGGAGEGEETARFAVMQDRRGRWQETYQARWTEPECAFTSTPCAGESESFRLSIPAWEVDGTLEKVTEVLAQTDEPRPEPSPPADGLPPEGTFWTSLEGLPQAKHVAPVDFCLLRGNLQVQTNARAAYGIGLLVRQP